MGVTATTRKIQQRYWWPRMSADIRDFVTSCQTCQKHKPTLIPTEHKLHSIHSGYPMQLVQIDIAGPLQETPSGNRYALFIVDSFTGWLEVVPLHQVVATDVANALLSSWITRYGASDRLLSDQGSNVAGEVIKGLCDILKTKKIRTTPYHPQGNGKAERVIGTVKRLLRAVTNETGWPWDTALPLVLMAYRSAVHNSTGFTPHRLMFGREIVLPKDSDLKNIIAIPSSQYAQDIRSTLLKLENLARDNLGAARRRQESVHNRKVRRHRGFKSGDKVWRVNRASNKKNKPRLGPYLIVEERSHDTYKIIDEERQDNQIIVVNGRDLVPVIDRIFNCSSPSEDYLPTDSDTDRASDN